jgi:hypothetical protein
MHDPTDQDTARRHARYGLYRVHQLLARTLDAIEADPGIPAEEATPEDYERARAAFAGLIDALDTLQALLGRLDALERAERDQARRRAHVSRLN